MSPVRLSPSDFIALVNQTLEFAYPAVEVEGEVQSFKVNQNKYVFFDLKDEAASVGCFMMVFQLRLPLEDGMKVVVTASPKLTKWGKFSLTVRTVQPLGEGSLKRGFELLKAKLDKEGLFDPTRKRPLPRLPAHIGIISSTQAAGYADFIKILGERWGGLKIEVAHVQVQGAGAADQIMRALSHFNQAQEPPEVIALIRGGGSLDDLSTFNDELLVRAVAASRVPIVTGIGHETDLSLTDMAADVQASTPSNAAQILVPDRREISARLGSDLTQARRTLLESLVAITQDLKRGLTQAEHRIEKQLIFTLQHLKALKGPLAQLNPVTILGRGYSIVRDASGKLVDRRVRPGDELSVETKDAIIATGVKHVEPKTI